MEVSSGHFLKDWGYKEGVKKKGIGE